MSPSKIEWTGETWNPTTGCDSVSPGCNNCYAMTLAKRLKGMGQAKYQRDGDPRTSGPGFGLTVHPDALNIPLRRRKPTTWFVDSMSDLFHPEVPKDFVERVFATMAACPQHTFQILTKRPQRMKQLVRADPELKDYYGPGGAWGAGETPSPWRCVTLPNVWLGTSIESDRYAFRADHLRATPATIRFLSLEPLLGPLPSLDLTGIDWVIVGGESGPGARPMHPAWVRDIRDRCVDAGVAFFFKQWGAWYPGPVITPSAASVLGHGNLCADGRWLGAQPPVATSLPDTREFIARVGKKLAGRTLDGRTWDEMPGRVTV